MATVNLKIEALQDTINHAEWFGRQPYGPARMAEAVQIVENNPALVIALVSWWGDDSRWLPAGWTWLEVLEAETTGYRVMMDTEPKARENFIPNDEVVMLFHK